MAKTVVASTARAMTKVARAAASGATMITLATATMVATATAVAMATKVARMTPNGDEDNMNGNNKNNDKGTITVT